MALVLNKDVRAEAIKTEAIKVDTADRISAYRNIKAPQTVIKQTPAAGTPVVAGMTIEVQATSLSDVPSYVIDSKVIAAAKYVPVADAVSLIQDNEMLRKVAQSGIVNEGDRQTFVATINSGLSDTLTGEMGFDDAVNYVKAMGDSGLIEF